MNLLGDQQNALYAGSLADGVALAEYLDAAGLNKKSAQERASRFARVAARLPEGKQKNAFFVPGRIEILGKHTDYAGGRTMVVATEHGFSMAVAAREDRRVRISAVDLGETAEFELDADLKPKVGHWSNYSMTVARRIARNFPNASTGADIAFSSDLPPAAGMSSSSAVIVGIFLALAHVNRLGEYEQFRREIKTHTDLAGYLGTIENGQSFASLEGDRGVGTFGGSEDHTAILCGCRAAISQYSYCPVRFERKISVPSGYLFAVGVSGCVAEKTGAAREKYNAVSRRVSALVDMWQKETGRREQHLAAILGSGPDAAKQLAELAEASRRDDYDARSLSDRLKHFVAESTEIIPAAGDAFAAGRWQEFGWQVDRSQQLAERLLENQLPETIYLARRARVFDAVAASSFGAGFGGSVWALVERENIEAFLTRWSDDYKKKYPQRAAGASFFCTSAAPAAMRVC